MAPEVLQSKYGTGACDMWALGAITFELLTGKECFGAPTFDKILEKVLT
jgi:serine/threonine protein kinase